MATRSGFLYCSELAFQWLRYGMRPKSIRREQNENSSGERLGLLGGLASRVDTPGMPAIDARPLAGSYCARIFSIGTSPSPRTTKSDGLSLRNQSWMKVAWMPPTAISARGASFL